MAYDPGLAERVRRMIGKLSDFREKKMFGGVCYLIDGNMACGILNQDLIVRVGPERYEECLALPETRKFDITGKPMKGWVMVSCGESAHNPVLVQWVEMGVSYARSLPPKK